MQMGGSEGYPLSAIYNVRSFHEGACRDPRGESSRRSCITKTDYTLLTTAIFLKQVYF